MARKILLADDSVTAQNMGRKILSDAGYEVTTVNNGSAALKKIGEHKPDLIVLDVYMPGYSGLEVCQRIKESRETARIPVLLTVGKLEPFKPEEARRARADAYIVKPFEASELLVALSKLEERIVPQPEPYKPGRFAKAIAAVEGSNQYGWGDGFANAESGWKERLRFPSAKSKSKEPAAEAASPGSTGFRDLGPTEGRTRDTGKSFDRPLPAGIPQDITAEEIAAIAAAAAQLSGVQDTAAVAAEKVSARREEQPHEKDETTRPEPRTSEMVVATEAQAKDVAAANEEPAQAPAATFASATEAGRESREPAEVADAKPVEIPAHAAEDTASIREVATSEDRMYTTEDRVELGNQPATTRAADSSKPAPDFDAEVLAALQTLSRTDGGDGSSPEPTPPSWNTNQNRDDIPVTAAAAMATAEFAATVGGATGPRWIAEPVPLDSEESMLILEKEMEKAYAAFAAAEGARATVAQAAAAGAAGSLTDMAVVLAEPPVETGFGVPPPEYSGPDPDESPTLPTMEAVSEPGRAAGATDSAPAPETVGPIEPAQIAPEMATPATELQEPSSESTEKSAVPPASSWSDMHSLSGASPEEKTGGADDDTDRTYDAEIDAANAAAWANWRQIRDTVIASTSTATAAAAKDIRHEEPAGEETHAMAAAASSEASQSASAADPTAIASIVDIMLAELKPKLVEEIAKKMAAEKKKE